MLPYLRLRPGNLLLTFGAAMAAGLAAAALLLVQREVLDLAVGGHLAAMALPLGLLLGIGLVNFGAQRVAAYRELKAANDMQFLVYDAVHWRMQHIDSDGQALPPGQLAARLNADIDAMSRAVASLPKLGGAVLTTVITVAMMLVLHPLLGAITLLIVPLLWFAARRARRKIQPATWAAQQGEADVAQRATMAIAGVRVVKALGQEEREIARMAQTSERLYAARMRLIRLQASFQPILEAIPTLAQVLVVLVGGWLILHHQLTLGTFLVFTVYNGHLVSSVKWFADAIVRLQEAGVCAGRVLDLLDIPPAVVDDPAARPLPDLRGEIEFDRVRFGYAQAAPVLDGFSLRVAAGETIALVGAAGSGKSTVVKLLTRFHDPQAGAVRIDGIDLRSVTLDSLRRQVGVVFDDPMLFGGTIRDNITYGRPDADDAAVIAAARTAGVHDFVSALPAGYATAVGERGYTLSGGQRQRVALARTLLIEPRLLVLDDPTAGVDAEREHEIHQSIRAGGRERTTVLIGYRPSTVAHADRIIVMDSGRVVDEGRHEELMRRCALYRRLVDPAEAQDAVRAAGEQSVPHEVEAAVPRPDDPADGLTASAWLPVDRAVGYLSGDPRMRAAVARLAPTRDTVSVPAVSADQNRSFSVWRLLRPQRVGFGVALALLVVLTGLGAASPYFIRQAVDRGILAGSTRGVVGAALAILVATVVGLLLTRPTMTLAGQVGQRVVHALRLQVWAKLIWLPIDYYERSKAGRLLTRMINDVEGFSRFASTGLVTAVVSSLTILSVLAVMLFISPLLAGLAVAAALPFVAVLKRYNSRIAAAYLNAREEVAEANAVLQENLAGIRESQAFGQQDRTHARYRELIQRYLDYRLSAERLSAATYPVVSFLSGLALSLVLGVGAIRLAEGALTAGDLFAIVLCVTIFFPPTVELAIFFTSDVKRVEVSTKRIKELMAQDLGSAPPATPIRPAKLRGELRLAGVRFTYPRTETEVLHGVELTVAAGTTVALVGATGAGKSTIIKLMAHFYDPTGGQVLVDNVDLLALDPVMFRRRLGYLPQEPYLFAGSIRDNIAYGRPEASDREVEAAASAVGAHEGIRGLAGGYLHLVGERGGALSAGLRQLVCLARVYLVDPAIVLLDEATAKLDLATEAHVLAAIRKVTRGRTTVMITHRLQTAMVADEILMVSDGRIVERGTHEDLLAAGGRYASLCEASVLLPAPV